MKTHLRHGAPILALPLLACTLQVWSGCGPKDSQEGFAGSGTPAVSMTAIGTVEVIN